MRGARLALACATALALSAVVGTPTAPAVTFDSLTIPPVGRDDWTPAVSCRELAASPTPRPAPVLLQVYPEAYHSFDNPSATRQYLPNVENANKPGGGANIGYDPAARADAIIRVQQFLAEHLTAPP